MSYSKILSYDYLKLLSRDLQTQQIFEIFAPFIPIKISFKNKSSFEFNAIVDSGASRNLFPAVFGQQAGINIQKGKQVKLLGIGDKEIIGYTHLINIHLNELVFETEADFSFEQRFPLLGRNGFFNLFQKVIFDETFHQLQLVLKSEKD